VWIKDLKSCDVSRAHSGHAKPPDIRHVPNALSFWNIFSPNSRNKFSVFIFKLKEWFERNQYTWKCTFKVLVEGRSFDKGAFRPYYFLIAQSKHLFASDTHPCHHGNKRATLLNLASDWWDLTPVLFLACKFFPKLFVTLVRPWQFFNV